MRRRIQATLTAYPWLVCAQRGEVVGYAYGGQHGSRAGYRWSVDSSVYIHASFHRRGVGRALYTSLFRVLGGAALRQPLRRRDAAESRQRGDPRIVRIPSRRDLPERRLQGRHVVRRRLVAARAAGSAGDTVADADVRRGPARSGLAGDARFGSVLYSGVRGVRCLRPRTSPNETTETQRHGVRTRRTPPSAAARIEKPWEHKPWICEGLRSRGFSTRACRPANAGRRATRCGSAACAPDLGDPATLWLRISVSSLRLGVSAASSYACATCQSRR